MKQYKVWMIFNNTNNNKTTVVTFTQRLLCKYTLSERWASCLQNKISKR